MSRTPRRLLTSAVALTAILSLTACGGSNQSTSTDSSGSGQSADSSAAAALETITPGKLTIGTGEPAYSPWVENDDPESGEGFEAAVAYAVAEEMGFAKEDVVWVRTPFDTVIAPGPKDFDLNIQQFSITSEREQAVDFSSPYYTATQGVLSIKGNNGADATSLADLKDAKIGVAVGANALDIVNEQIAPSSEVAIFNSNADVVLALNAGQIDAMVTDLPTVLNLASTEVENGVVVGQIDSTEGGDEYAFLLEKDSPLTASVTKAVDALQANGTLEELANKWIAEGASAPVLK